MEYMDGGKPNDSRHAGYISWSPAAQFEGAYKEVQTVTRSYVCGVTCQKAGPTCNGYCTNGLIPSPGSYTIPLMDFGRALQMLKEGKKVARIGWNGKGMFVYYVPAASYPVQTGAAKSHFGEGSMVPYNAYMAIKNVDETVSTWVPSVNDCLSEDWMVIA